MIGIMSVREAHGFIAVNALAQLACEAPQTAKATEEQARYSTASLNGALASIKTAPPLGTRPLFVHLGMGVEATTASPLMPRIG